MAIGVVRKPLYRKLSDELLIQIANTAASIKMMPAELSNLRKS
jgi:hypothetical protein